MRTLAIIFFLAFLFTCSAFHSASAETIAIGSKKFTESYVLGEIAKKAIEDVGLDAQHKQGMGGTIILWQALKSGAIDLYPDYTGTIQEEILKVKGAMTPDAMREALARDGIGVTSELGFDNTYALAMPRKRAEELGIRNISDLREHPSVRVGLSHEFIKRQDGWEHLTQRYGLELKDVRGMEHSLAYAALGSNEIDLTDAYSTDAKLLENNLVVLRDDKNFFPQYQALFLYRLNMPPKAIAALHGLERTFSEEKMIRLNAEAEYHKDYTKAAALYFGDGRGKEMEARAEILSSKIMRWTLRHLQIVVLSLMMAIALGIPLGIIASRPGSLSQGILGAAGIIQTIPSLALLALLVSIPFLGISPATAVVALILYSLLPIIRNTAAGLQNIPASLRESAAALGLSPAAQMGKIFLPMASRTILAGIKTSAIINVGTATIAALIGAGGLGEPIISGLNLNDSATILQGAIPAALLALLVQCLFGLLDRVFIPRGLKLSSSLR